MKVDFVISVRGRENERIQRCVDNLQSEILGEVIVVDYCSDTPVELKNCKIIRIDKRMKWNKSHALNIGIKACKNDFIGTIDCDIVLTDEFKSELPKYLNENTFIFTRNVKRVQIIDAFDLGLNLIQLMKLSTPWVSEDRIHHFGVGGIQIFPREWIRKVHGYDESMFYWGGMDNDVYERALRDRLILIDINKPIFHQEHEKQKEQNLLNGEEVLEAQNMRAQRREYLILKSRENIIIGPSRWGGKTPNKKTFVDIDKDGKQNMINKKIKEVMKNKKDISSEELSEIVGSNCKIIRPDKK